METRQPLPFVVHTDGTDEPSDVIDATSLAEFVAGRQPFAVTLEVQRLKPDAPLVKSWVPPRGGIGAPGRLVGTTSEWRARARRPAGGDAIRGRHHSGRPMLSRAVDAIVGTVRPYRRQASWWALGGTVLAGGTA